MHISAKENTKTNSKYHHLSPNQHKEYYVCTQVSYIDDWVSCRWKSHYDMIS